jgi:uncharacterized protein YukJ
MIKNSSNRKWKNVIKQRYKQQTSLIYVSSNNDRHPVTKTFTTLHYTSVPSNLD